MGSITKVVLALCIVLATLFLVQPYRPVVVRGISMMPTFQDGQLVFAVPLTRKPKVGDIVLVEKDGSTLVKRVTMVPGDEYLEAKSRFTTAWSMVTTTAVKDLVKRHLLASRTSVIPDGEVFIAGDNTNFSLDSRSFGTVPISSIRGVVVPIV